MAKILIFDMLFKFESLFLFVHVFFCCFGSQIQRTPEILFADNETFGFYTLFNSIVNLAFYRCIEQKCKIQSSL